MDWKLFALVVLLVCIINGAALAETWVVWELAPSEDTELPYREIIFTFENGLLTLNTDQIATWPGSSQTRWDLLFSGNWAVTGTVDTEGNLVADPYATFVHDGYGGYIQWEPDTPNGYVVPLMLGTMFNGSGAATYQGYDFEPWGDPVTGTLVVWQHLSLRLLEYDRYYAVGHTFYATVPEPSSLAALGLAISGAGAALMRRRRT